ncbi:OadG-related small transporter subunit [Otoolea muris]
MMWNNFLVSLEIMGKGMGGIFVVVLIITAVVMILGKLK